MNKLNIAAILFDLDGTLVDTYLDLREAANHVLNSIHYPEISNEVARELATDGMLALLRASMKDEIEQYDQNKLKQKFLEYYLNHINVYSKPFPYIVDLISRCQEFNIPWGVVTNKPSFLTLPLMKSIAEFAHCSVIVCSDDLPEKKPDPRPLTFALEKIGVSNINRTIYIGDHIRDIQCGNNAGAITIAAAWGYISPKENLEKWDASFIANDAGEIIQTFLQQ